MVGPQTSNAFRQQELGETWKGQSARAARGDTTLWMPWFSSNDTDTDFSLLDS